MMGLVLMSFAGTENDFQIQSGFEGHPVRGDSMGGI